MKKKVYIVTFKVEAVNAEGRRIIDKLYQSYWNIPTVKVGDKEVYQSDEEILTEKNLDSLASQLVLDITNSLSNQQLTPEMQKQILPDWGKSSVVPIGIIPIYADEEDNNDKDSSNS